MTIPVAVSSLKSGNSLRDERSKVKQAQLAQQHFRSLSEEDLQLGNYMFCKSVELPYHSTECH